MKTLLMIGVLCALLVPTAGATVRYVNQHDATCDAMGYEDGTDPDEPWCYLPGNPSGHPGGDDVACGDLVFVCPDVTYPSDYVWTTSGADGLPECTGTEQLTFVIAAGAFGSCSPAPGDAYTISGDLTIADDVGNLVVVPYAPATQTIQVAGGVTVEDGATDVLLYVQVE